MSATSPTTMPTLSLYKLCACPLDPMDPRLWFFCGVNPTDPFIARKWCDILPYYLRHRSRNNGLS